MSESKKIAHSFYDFIHEIYYEEKSEVLAVFS